MLDLNILSYVDGNIKPNFLNFSYVNHNNLAQRVIKLLLTEKGSDAFNPELGASLISISKMYNETKQELFTITLKTSISNLVNIIKQEQASLNLDNEDLLEDILINSIKYDKVNLGWRVELSIVNKNKHIIKFIAP